MKLSWMNWFWCLIAPVCLAAHASEAQLNSFRTGQDMMATELQSNVQLYNDRNTASTVYGLYIRQYAYVEPGTSCDSPTIIYSASQNAAAGALVAPITIKAKSAAAIGRNYLYNMIYNANYVVNVLIPSSPPGCVLPGCTWGSDTHRYDWCIYLGALAPVSLTGNYTSHVPPVMEPVSSGSYNYDLVSAPHYIGPITCNDQTLNCWVRSTQSQLFS